MTHALHALHADIDMRTIYMVDRISSRIAGRFSGSITISRIALADICRFLWLSVYQQTPAMIERRVFVFLCFPANQNQEWGVLETCPYCFGSVLVLIQGFHGGLQGRRVKNPCPHLCSSTWWCLIACPLKRPFDLLDEKEKRMQT